MKIKTYFIIIALFTASNLHAQQFINKAVIEYEVKSNFKKNMGNRSWIEQIDNLSTFKTAYFTLTFADNKSIYKFDRWDPTTRIPDWFKKNDEENIWFYDYNNSRYNIQKNIWGSSTIIEDSIPKLEWRLSNENRIIAGFNCRKAVAKILDSVYVFAFYTDEILISGGPSSINGLPGMILGLTIPRLFTSWIATKVSLNGVDAKSIKPVEEEL
jgi:GLPGLI family protein